MPINLDAIPDKQARAARPKTQRWLIFGLIWMLVGAILCLWLWQEERSGARFWFLFLWLPFASGLMLFGFRRLAYKCEQVWVEGWNSEREVVLASEIQRGQRHAVLTFSTVISALDAQGAELVSTLVAQQSINHPQTDRMGNEPVVHNHLPGRDLESVFLLSLKNVTRQLAYQLTQLPEQYRCYLSLQFDTGLPPEQEQRLWQTACQDASLTLSDKTIILSATGLMALDNWLDRSGRYPSILIVVTAQLHASAEENSGEAVVAMIFATPSLKVTSAESLPLIHRPQLDSMERATLAVERGLLWAKLDAKQMKGLWVFNESLQSNAQWSHIVSDMALPTNNWNIEPVLGDMGITAPWMALTASSQAAQQLWLPQLYVYQPDESSLWVGAVSLPAAEKKARR